MKCHRCQIDNPNNRRFCAACGSALDVTCPSCDLSNQAGEEFCTGCGAWLAQGAAASRHSFESPRSYTPQGLVDKILTSKSALEGERKQVTVLFADLKSSMELVEGRDPEEARALLDPVLERMMEAVHYYEGTVNQVMGDGIMALFGAPLAIEDHGLRACYAALRMQQSVNRYADEARREPDSPIRIRIGLNSGEVVVRSIGSDLRMDYTAVGQTTHLAARMEQEAAPGSILITANVLVLAEGYVRTVPLGPRVVKGMTRPVDVYELAGASTVRSRFDAAATRGLSRFVGRNQELDELNQASARARLGYGQMVAVSGEAGVGKSRLFWEFLQSVSGGDWLIVRCSAASYARAAAYSSIIDLLKAFFQIEANEDGQKIRDRIASRLPPVEPQEGDSALSSFLWLLDVPYDDPRWERLDPPQRRQRTLDCVVQLLLSESHARPLLLVFENLHWIDGESQAILDGLVERLGDARILLLVNYRPEYRHGWAGRAYYRQHRIKDLRPESADALLNALLGDDPSLRHVKQLLTERTDGNPLFLEECVKSLVETNVVVGEPGHFRLERPTHTIQVPATVQAILAARIDQLAPEDKRLLQAASVVGRDVSFALLEAIAEENGEALRRALAHLHDAEFLFQTSVFPEVAFNFKHALTQEVAYGSLLKRQRLRLHVVILEALERLNADRESEQIDRLAYHAFKGELWGKAASCHLKAALKSIRLSAYAAALEHLSAGLDAVGRVADTADRLSTELDLQVYLGSVLITTRGWGAAEVERTYMRARELCDAVGSTSRLFPVLWGIATFFLLRCRAGRAADTAKRFFDLALDAEEDGPRLVGEFLMGNTLFWTGALTRARLHLENSIARYDTSRHESLADLYGQDICMSALSYLALTMWHQGYPDQALRYHDEAVRIARVRNHANSIAYAESMRLLGLMLRGANRSLFESATNAITFAEEKGLGYWSMFDRTLQAWTAARRDSTPEAVATMRRAFETYRTTGAELPVVFRSMIADACLRAGETQSAIDEVNLALEAVESFEDRIWESEVYRLKGECLLAMPEGSETEAEKCFRRAIDVSREWQARSLELRAALSLSRLMRKRGEPELARGVLEPVYETFTEGFDTIDLQEARGVLAEIRVAR